MTCYPEPGTAASRRVMNEALQGAEAVQRVGPGVLIPSIDPSAPPIYMATGSVTPRPVRIIGPDDRPQDPTLDGSTLRFTTHEHGGAEPDTMPQAIRVTDAEGRTATYVPLEVAGQIVEFVPDAKASAG